MARGAQTSRIFDCDPLPGGDAQARNEYGKYN
jgi:hypothetical protein